MGFRLHTAVVLTAAAVAVSAGMWSSPATANDGRNIALVIDASGSMNGRLVDGTPKIDAAKSAVADLTGKMPKDINLSLRAYGHQSPRAEKNCKDTAILVPFGKASDVSSDVIGKASGLTAQGYTPITYVLGLAADDLKPLSGAKTIVLVSDGKETCAGDPCVLARRLKEADADLTIHTVGFGVDATTRSQLHCIASAGGGSYFDAESASGLSESMMSAATVEPETEAVVITIKKKVPGILEIENGQFHDVFDAETDEKVGSFAPVTKQMELPAGIYNVDFGDGLIWKSVEIKPGETTTLRPGVLMIANHKSHDVLDPETREAVKSFVGVTKFVALPPGPYVVTFGAAEWPIELAEGQELTLNPGGISVTPGGFYEILFENGEEAASLSPIGKRAILPPGKYALVVDDQKVPVEITEGKMVEFKIE